MRTPVVIEDHRGQGLLASRAMRTVCVVLYHHVWALCLAYVERVCQSRCAARAAGRHQCAVLRRQAYGRFKPLRARHLTDAVLRRGSAKLWSSGSKRYTRARLVIAVAPMNCVLRRQAPTRVSSET